jgi:hypothetical protein
MLRWPRDTLYPLKLALMSPTRGGRSLGIVRWRTKAPEVMHFNIVVYIICGVCINVMPSLVTDIDGSKKKVERC